MTFTVTQFQESVQNWLDSTGADAVANATTSVPRWGTTVINSVGGQVFQEEWTGLLNQNRNYTFSQVSVTTDGNGCVSVAQLTTGTGDATQNFHRILSGFTDGLVLYRETDYDRVPLGTLSNYQSPWDFLYYLAGGNQLGATANFQLLPLVASNALTAFVNWTPMRIDLLSSSASVINFPDGYENILSIQTAGRLLGKGGNEGAAANMLFAMADDMRKGCYAYLGRLTTRPSSLQFPDLAVNWMGG